MKLLWKLLRHNISHGQMCGFALANLFGMIIILSGYQFYNDVLPILTSEDSFMKSNYIMVTKHIGMGKTLSGRNSSFTEHDIAELKAQTFIKKIGKFTSTNYKTDARMNIGGKQILNTEMFFESVPDEFIDVDKNLWTYTPGSTDVPVILPRTYVNMYNFGFARAHSMPLISDGLLSMIDINIIVHVNGEEKKFRGHVVALSGSLSAILVPQKFMDWSNNEFAPNEVNTSDRLLMEVTDVSDKATNQYFEDNGLELESDKINTEKTVHFLRLLTSLVITIGLIISILSFYTLILSIYLLVQKNTDKLQNLLLIGYTRKQVSLPYQLLAATLNLAVLILAILAVIIIRLYYMELLQSLYSTTSTNSVVYTIILGLSIFIIITLLNTIIIRNKIAQIHS